ncbi:hypothetical protein [Winogradskyella sp. UBA3174]|uniref:hypothetical protein n=1 Tax=Winogradskyella sp. UBA3174 TaxID=1947785 RepID=UPI0025D1372F|nr:hypothetical protein [Winogradskyella sp. UBA3174]|tara:strand:+ start:14259 stop:14930 length:672 start_codon:yes stop_codon:yes gene_type:complete
MKKFIHPLLLLTTILFFSSCSSVKVLNSWKGENAYTVKNNNILVIARTDNMSARIAFENEIVKDLTAKDIKATASFEKFPKLDPDKKLTEAEQKKIKTMLLESGFNGVILTVVKEEEELTKRVTDGGYYAGSNYYGFYPRYYNGFYGYYGNVNSFSTLGNYVEPTSQTYTATNYVVETLIYNLDEPEDKQLVAVVTSKLEEPDNAATTAHQYVKAISKSFDKK